MVLDLRDNPGGDLQAAIDIATMLISTGHIAELRYKDPELSKNLPTIQGATLGNACKYVKHGGTLVYSTCTVFPEENENVIEAFLFNNPDFSLSEWSVGKIHAPNGMLTLLPHIHGTDGFFIAKLIKK